MPDKLVAEKLDLLIERYGDEIISEPKRLEALLRDHCQNNYRREINILISAVNEQVPAELLSSSMPPQLLYARLITRLQDDLAMAEDAAQWAVQTWVNALFPEKRQGPALPTNAPAVPQAEQEIAGQPFEFTPDFSLPQPTTAAHTDTPKAIIPPLSMEPLSPIDIGLNNIPSAVPPGAVQRTGQVNLPVSKSMPIMLIGKKIGMIACAIFLYILIFDLVGAGLALALESIAHMSPLMIFVSVLFCIGVRYLCAYLLRIANTCWREGTKKMDVM